MLSARKQTLNIGICSIGSGIGRAVLDACNLSNLDLITVGLGNDKFVQSAFDCNHAEEIPSFHSRTYIVKLTEIAKKYEIDLLVPGHDNESTILAENHSYLFENGVNSLVPSLHFLNICRDKLNYHSHFYPCRSLFVNSYTNQQALNLVRKGQIHFPLIAKPLSGFASQGIEIINNEAKLADAVDGQIVQQIAVPKTGDPEKTAFEEALASGKNLQVAEISIQLLFDQQGDLITWCATRNSLKNGVPVLVIPIANGMIAEAVCQLQLVFKKQGATGPVNVQGRITDDGFKIFEINARFTGITGLRAALGFNEVEEMIRHSLMDSSIRKMTLNMKRVGLRSVRSSVISSEEPKLLQDENAAPKTGLNEKQIILITGTTGLLGRELVKALQVNNDKICIWTLNLTSAKAPPTIESNTLNQTFEWRDLSTGRLDLRQVDKIVHLGSARPWATLQEMSHSMKVSAELFNNFAKYGVGTIIFASSQSVYDSSVAYPWNEDHSVAPNTPYGIHKYSSELVLRSIAQGDGRVKVCILRIASLIGELPNHFSHDVIHKMVEDAISSGTIKVSGGSQQISRLHYQDALNGIKKCLDSDISNGCEVFNLTNNEKIEVSALALVIQRSLLTYGYDVKIKYSESSSNTPIFTPQSNKFMSRFSWAPRHAINDIIQRIIEVKVSMARSQTK